ncbi:hypothetical protein AVEN_118016-1 [Araneus ventricosus]|uniref:Uncharacterized protein n=1 Tax=Araneus ventricosus TaxID=182803 RepID=A0A4Y2CBI6_ARAVE|nr:hypothetical protein AVEN_118016-1 [Araneus ventricosus]
MATCQQCYSCGGREGGSRRWCKCYASSAFFVGDAMNVRFGGGRGREKVDILIAEGETFFERGGVGCMDMLRGHACGNVCHTVHYEKGLKCMGREYLYSERGLRIYGRNSEWFLFSPVLLKSLAEVKIFCLLIEDERIIYKEVFRNGKLIYV